MSSSRPTFFGNEHTWDHLIYLDLVVNLQGAQWPNLNLWHNCNRTLDLENLESWQDLALDHQKSRLEPSWRAEASLRWTRTQVTRECRLEFRSCESNFATVCHFEGVMSTIPVLFVCILLFPPGMITNRISLQTLVLATSSRRCVEGKQKLLPQRIIQVLQRHQVTPGLPWRLFLHLEFLDAIKGVFPNWIIDEGDSALTYVSNHSRFQLQK